MEYIKPAQLNINRNMTQPSYHTHEEFRNRTEKLHEMRALGIDPYPAKIGPLSRTAREVQEEYREKALGGSEEAEGGKTEHVVMAGRLVLLRAMGKNAFAQLQDSTGRIQLMFSRDAVQVEGLGESGELTPMKFVEKKIDLGDWIGVEGHLFRTHKGEVTVFVRRVTVLCKTLLPLPDKHAGLNDVETRYRKRWLDLIVNPEVMERFRKRSEIMRAVRGVFQTYGFMEVETPILQGIYGGAEARPFVTEIEALHQTMYLRIAIEIALKKLIVGGMDRVYEIGKVFRNEGLDRTHNPEFTMLEAYAAYWDYEEMMRFTEFLFEKVAVEVLGTTQVEMDGQVVDLKAPWIRMSMVEAIRVYGKIDVEGESDEGLRGHLENVEELKGAPRGILIAKMFEKFAEPHLIQPHHIIDHPIETTPLCKPHRNLKLREQGFVERFESFILGKEFCNSYTELNDPELQRKLLEQQAELREKGNKEAHPLDEEFIEAISQGMPPTGGLGIGMDRFVMLLTNAPSIRDVLLFPIMRNEEGV